MRPLLSKEAAAKYYKKCLETCSNNLSPSQKIIVFQHDLEQGILREITNKTELKEQFDWLEDNKIMRGKPGEEEIGFVPEVIVSDIKNLKKWRNVSTHDPKMKVTKIKYLSHFETMVRTIKFFSGVEWPDEIKDIISDNQNAYEELTYDKLIQAGTRCHKNGKFKEALEFFERAEEKIQGDKKRGETLYGKMADTYLKSGEYGRALSLFREALKNCILVKGEDNFQTARYYQKIGIVLRKDRQYEKAKENFENSKKILDEMRKEDPNDPNVANLYNDFGLMYLNEKKFEDAHFYYELAYSMREENYEKYGKEEKEGYYVREYAYSVHNMGTYYNQLVVDRFDISNEERIKRFKEAADLHERAYNLRMDLLDGRKPLDVIKESAFNADLCLDIAQSLTLWATDLLELDKAKVAEEKCKEGLEIREAMQGTSIQDKAWSYYTLGLIKNSLKKNEEALKCFSESYRIRFKASNDNHPYAAKALYQMGLMKSKLDIDKKEVLGDLMKAAKIQKQFLNENDPELIKTLELIDKLEN